MKNILCFGDSNTWGYDARTESRFPPDVRWPGVLRLALGEGYHIIEEGLCGRTTVWDDPIEGYKNGKEYLIPCLETHKPLDLVIIMLGTNDLKKRFSLSASDIAAGAGVLVDAVNKSGAGKNGEAPKVLLVSPPEVGDIGNSRFDEMFGFENCVAISKNFSKHFKRITEYYGCTFLDAAPIVIPSPIDAIHFDASEHKKLGEEIARMVKAIQL
ncbi:MAG: SGNH/GDSL hydrolase family protein [Clostridia bacterium]|nr:SGNH/GDSL hydrolase family protein [Clostridia bacterium]